MPVSDETIKRVIDDLETKAAEKYIDATEGELSCIREYDCYQYAVEQLRQALQDG
ncbi:hypothetical protein [Cohnella sp. GCM10012308]|uniref:hypothetical protein n=1 Tax=Cohnella sp. GCM10012308 TaxID=3317329 RepID=UPI00361EE58D